MLRGRWMTSAVTVLAGLAVLGGPAGANAGNGQTLVLPVGPQPLAKTITVTGQAWAPSTMFSVALCGHDDADGSVDCDFRGSANVVSWPDGSLHALLRLARPPVNCPCVVTVSEVDGGQAAQAPIVIAGVPVDRPSAPLSRASEPAVPRVVSAHVTSSWDWGSLFGGPAPRTLVLTLAQPGGAVGAVNVTVLEGRRNNDTGYVGARAVQFVGSRAQATMRMSLSLPALSFGRYHVHGALVGGGQPVAFDVQTTAWPWGLIGIFALSALLAAVALVRGILRPLESEPTVVASVVVDDFVSSSSVGAGLPPGRRHAADTSSS